MEPLHLPITLCMVGSGLTFLYAKCGTQLLCQCRGEVCTVITQEFGRHTEHCSEPLIQNLCYGLGCLTLGNLLSSIVDSPLMKSVDQLQQHVCPNWAQRGLCYCSLKDVTPLTTLYQSSAVLNHHGPLESFLHEGLVPHIMVDPRDQERQDSLSLLLGMVLTYNSPLLITRLLHTWKSACPYVSTLSPKYFLNNASLFKNGVSYECRAISCRWLAWDLPPRLLPSPLCAWVPSLLPGPMPHSQDAHVCTEALH